MPLFWHRWGILAFLVPLLIAALIQLLIDFFAGSGYYSETSWPKAIAVLLGASAIGIVGYSLNHKLTSTNQKHRFFWLPMEYWAPIYLVLGLYAAFK
jgi:hypothetical protein